MIRQWWRVEEEGTLVVFHDENQKKNLLLDVLFDLDFEEEDDGYL